MEILLASDGSEFAEAGAALISRLPFPAGSRVTVVTVISDLGLPDLGGSHAGAIAQMRRSLRREAERTLVKATRRLRENSRNVDVEIREGHVAEQILECSKEIRADLLIVGSRGLGTLKRYLLGSISHRVIRHCDCSALVARPRAAGISESGRLKILVAFDGSESSWTALRSIASLRLQNRVDLRVIRVLTLVTAYRMDIVQKMTALFQEQQATAQVKLQEASRIAAQSGAEVDSKLIEGEDAADLIVRAAAEFDADLIVLGDKGEGAIERFLLGSITSKVAHHAPCSVLIVKGKGFAGG